MKSEKHGRGVEQAWQALEVFASVGAHRFDITQTDLDGRKRSFRPSQELERLHHWLPQLMASAIQHQRNIIVRPQGATATLVQLDDIGAMALERLRGRAFLMLTTSPANHQAWVAVRECVSELARRLRQGSGADPSASGATRLAGSINYKRKYAPEFPSVTILETIPERIVTPSELESTGLVAPPDARRWLLCGRVSPARGAKQWPSYERCLQGAPRAHQSDRPDVSRADFTFCMIAIDWGWSLEDTSARLLEKSRKARENGETYAKLTVQRAAAAVVRRRGSDVP